ncbi:uncharacterized protein Z518_09965 [Rhinocladiella mackenziei CBS 650.93]|uniref:Delta(24)-sterol reductase n=1 Tax=Rhinocladiella mackenziei CBS 650.93 TaxID=1442369 RepID=A0A0D2IW36_9EURO|nr:uncharacterized protein Z518_09965 [Rhinocladiella mackenziei CBS 650.93]KIX00900.1 hypothetical protein Z518_09965 [Rhinocladiella mackenziei CBS 650.93]
MATTEKDKSLALRRHTALVSSVSQQIAHFHTQKTPFRIFHGNTNSTRPSERTKTGTIDISALDNVLSVSPAERTCLVEPNVPMDVLVAATLPYGLVPPVIPEFPGITVGGGYAGTAGESSSFRYGFFDRTVNWIEVILADGKIVIASENEREDLFRGTAGTFGTLGVTTLFEVRLIPAKSFVELAYIGVQSIEEAQAVMKQVGEGEEMDFLDGIMFARDKGVVMAGKFSEQHEKNRELNVVTFTKPWDPWFYLHAEKMVNLTPSSSKRTSNGEDARQIQALISTAPQDLIPLTDYLFRYDRGAFWTGKFAYSWFLTPFNRLTRWLVDHWMHARTMYHALHRSGLINRFIIQDVAVPNRNIPAFSSWLDEYLPHIYPRWLCPLKLHETVSMHPHLAPPAARDEDSLLNIGVWGPTPKGMLQISVNRRIEAELKRLEGMKWLYAQTFYTEAEFWAIYDRDWYDGLRRKYRAEGLPSVYEKVRTRFEIDEQGAVVGDMRMGIEKGFWSIWPFAGVYGLLSMLKGGDYLRKKT